MIDYRVENEDETDETMALPHYCSILCCGLELLTEWILEIGQFENVENSTLSPMGHGHPSVHVDQILQLVTIGNYKTL